MFFRESQSFFRLGQGQTKDFWARSVRSDVEGYTHYIKTERSSRKQKNVPVTFFRPILIAERAASFRVIGPNSQNEFTLWIVFRKFVQFTFRIKSGDRNATGLGEDDVFDTFTRVRVDDASRVNAEIKHGLNLCRTCTVKVRPEACKLFEDCRRWVTLDRVVRRDVWKLFRPFTVDVSKGFEVKCVERVAQRLFRVSRGS